MLSDIQLVLAIGSSVLFCPKCEWHYRCKPGTVERKISADDAWCPECGFYIDGIELENKAPPIQPDKS